VEDLEDDIFEDEMKVSNKNRERKNDIRRKIEDKLEQRKLMEDFDLDEDF
jgi:hypothetical protein